MKFWVGDEDNGLQQDKIDWIIQTFDQDAYDFVDEGYFQFDRYVRFKHEKDATAYKLRWA